MYNPKGFTIVELLIVIVVIAVLATIAFIAYNGIQERARNGQLLSSFDAAEKAIRLHHAENEKFPSTLDENGSLIGTADNPNMPYACVGQLSDYPKNDLFEEGECYKYNGLNYGINSSVFNDQLKPFSPNLRISTNNLVERENGAALVRGILYTGDGNGGALFYMQNGNQECGRGSKTLDDSLETPDDTMTTCGIMLGSF